MNVLRTNRSFFASPHAAVFLLLTANILVYGFCLAQTGLVAIPADVLLRVGAFYFIVIYVCALVAGAVASNATHSGPYLTVGASAAISGVLGALLSLRILARVDLPASFFIINIGLNLALALANSSIDWAAHLGGFAAGMIVCALLDIV